MTASPVRRAFAVAAVLVAAAHPAPIAAQAPQALEPRALKPRTLEPPARLQPPPAEVPRPETVPAAIAPEAPPPGPVAVEIDRGHLRPVDPDATGVLEAGAGGFGADMWRGTPRELVQTLLPKLPTGTPSRAMRDLMTRLLLSTADPPQGEGRSGDLVAARLALLAAMGNSAAVTDLLAATPGRGNEAALVRIEADNRLLANDVNRACVLAAGQIGRAEDLFWQKAFIFCQALAGEHDKAALGMSLLREMGDEDAVFFDLVDSLSGPDPSAIESLPDPSPLHLAVARVAKAQLPADAVSSAHPGVLGTIAASPNAPVALRLEAAERAEAAGALPIETLRQLYTSVAFSDEDLANPLSKTEAESGPLSRALLYRTALIQTVPAAQAEAVARALALGREGGRYASTVRGFMPILERIPVSAPMLWFAPDAVRALLAGGAPDAAGPWFAQMRSSALFDETAAVGLARVLPLARIAGSPEASEWSPDDLAAWWDTVRDDEEAPARAALLYSLMEALDEPVPADLWGALLDRAALSPVVMPHPALWQRLAATAADRRVGETVLIALLTLGESGPGGADPIVLGRVIGSLRAIGLDAEARALALEAALAAGL